MNKITTTITNKHHTKKMNTIIKYTDICLPGLIFDINLANSRSIDGENRAKQYIQQCNNLGLKKRLTSQTIEYFKSDSGAYHAVRDILENINTLNFNEVVKVFLQYFPVASEDWKYALFCGLTVKANQTENNTYGFPYIYNCHKAQFVRLNRGDMQKCVHFLSQNK